MKCAVCQQGLTLPAWTLAVTDIANQVRVINAHKFCMQSTIGAPAVRRLDALATRVGWEQLPLPGAV